MRDPFSGSRQFAEDVEDREGDADIRKARDRIREDVEHRLDRLEGVVDRPQHRIQELARKGSQVHLDLRQCPSVGDLRLAPGAVAEILDHASVEVEATHRARIVRGSGREGREALQHVAVEVRELEVQAKV